MNGEVEKAKALEEQASTAMQSERMESFITMGIFRPKSRVLDIQISTGRRKEPYLND